MVAVNYEIYKKIRLFLHEDGVPTPATTESGNLNVNRIICAIWHSNSDRADRKKAIDQFKAFKKGEYFPSSPSTPGENPFASPSIPADSPNPQAQIPQSRGFDGNYAAKGMSVAYSSDKQKFWGKSDEDWPTKLSRYQFMCSQNKVTGSDRISYMHYLLDGAALQFFINEIEDRVSNYGDVIRRFNERHASAAKQDYISQRLSQIHIAQFETEDEPNPAVALRNTIDEIDRLTPMSHPEDRTDRAKTLHLQRAVVGREWARNVLSNVSANQLNYHTLIERLEYSLQQSEKHREASINEATSLGNALRTYRWKGTNFAGQGRFAHVPRSRNSIIPKHLSFAKDHRNSYRRKYPKETWPRRNSENSNATCHNCGKVGCRWYRCKEPMDMERVIRNRMAMPRRSSSGRSSSGVNLTEAVDDLANEMMETMLVSDPRVNQVTADAINEESDAEVDDDGLKEASFTTGVHFDLPEDDETAGIGDLNQPGL